MKHSYSQCIPYNALILISNKTWCKYFTDGIKTKAICKNEASIDHCTGL